MLMPPRTALRPLVGAACACLLAAAMPVLAAGDPPPKQKPQVPLNSGLSPQEFSADASKVTLEQRSDGTRIFHLNGQGMQSASARRDAGGRLEYTCSDKTDALPGTSPGAQHHAR